MSGLAVTLDPFQRDVDMERLRLLLDHMAWRGGDHRAVWRGPHIGVGAVQQWSTPEDWGTGQPVVDGDGRAVLVLDGRLDNRPELERELDRVRPVISDAALALAAYVRWGAAFVERLVGPFAVAVWDAEQFRLVCARDPLGQRPFYYLARHRTLWAASAIHALRAVLVPAATLDEDYLWDFLCSGGTVGSFDAAATPFREIRRLPAGHVLIATPNGIQVERYWKPWTLPPLPGGDEREDAEAFREIFTKAVAAQGRAPGPLAATLSGGLDSSSVVCALRQLERSGGLAGGPVHTLTLGWEEPRGPREGFNERPFVEAVVTRHPGPAHEIRADELSGLDFFGERPFPQDEPMLHFGQLWWLLANRARRLGSRVLLTGDGGDHLLAGNELFLADLLHPGRLLHLPAELRAAARRRHLSYPALIAGYVVAPRLSRPLGDRLARMLAREPGHASVDCFYYWHVPRWVRDPGRQRARGAARHRLLRRSFPSLAAQKDYERVALGSADHVRVHLHNLALAAGVDLRSPFFDRRLVELCLRLPPHRKAHDGTSKVILRRALGHILPAEVAARRDKTDYGFVLVDQVRQHWGQLEEVFRRSAAHEHGYVDGPALLEELAQVRQGGGGSVWYPSIIAALGLEDWLRSFDDPVPSRGAGGQAVENPRRKEVIM